LQDGQRAEEPRLLFVPLSRLYRHAVSVVGPASRFPP
jgi:hypothetical protein